MALTGCKTRYLAIDLSERVMMMNEFDFWFADGLDALSSQASARRAWGSTLADAIRTLGELDAARQPHAIELEISTRVGMQTWSLPEICERMLNILRSDVPAGQSGAYVGSWLTELHAVLRPSIDSSVIRLHVLGAPSELRQPAGMLLVDLRQPMSPEPAANDDEDNAWFLATQNALAQSGLARSGAEYAVALDVSSSRDVPHAISMLNALARAKRIASLLPADDTQASRLVDLSLSLSTATDDAEPHIQVRVWRLGFMKIAGQTHRA